MPLTNVPAAAAGFVEAIGYTSAPILHGVEKAAQTYIKGAFLIDDDAGRITEATSPISAAAVAQRTFGLALSGATGITGKDVEFVWLGPNAKLEVTLSDATAGTHTLAQADQWKVFPLLLDATSKRWYADANAVSDTGGIIIVEFKDPIGTVDARVYGILTNTVRGGANAGSAIF